MLLAPFPDGGQRILDVFFRVGIGIGVIGYPLHSSAVGGRAESVLPTMVSYVAGPTATAC
jgi:hypothetical protein